MSSLPLLNSVLGFLMTVPHIGPVLVKVLDILLAGSVIVTPLVGVWKALVALMQSLAKVPGLTGLAALAAQLQADDSKVEGVLNQYILPIIQDLSLISVPTAPAAPVAPTAPAAPVASG